MRPGPRSLLIVWLIALAVMAGCTEIEGTTIRTVDDVINASDRLQGETVLVLGTARQGTPVCTQIACSADNPCCNTCSASLFLDGEDGMRLEGEDIGCSGNNCRLNCTPMTPGRYYVVNGTYTLQNGNPVLQVHDVRTANATR